VGTDAPNGLAGFGDVDMAEILCHEHTIDGVSLSQRITVTIDDLAHSHINGVFSYIEDFPGSFIEIDDGLFVTQAQVLVIDSLTHEQVSGTVEFTQSHFLTIHDLVNAHGLDAINFAEGVVTVTFAAKSGSATFAEQNGRIVWTQ